MSASESVGYRLERSAFSEQRSAFSDQRRPAWLSAESCPLIAVRAPLSSTDKSAIIARNGVAIAGRKVIE
jgi:hypothetical protein